MTTKTEIQDLLRFLTQDAKVSLQMSMSKVKDLQKASLTSPEAIAKSTPEILTSIFTSDKLVKQISNAAKRVSKKRASSDPSAPLTSPAKRSKNATSTSKLTLPATSAPQASLLPITLQTNRAPLLLAFALTSLHYTMPTQPLSSRLSLAQAVVSANAQKKAVSIGLESEAAAAEEEALGQGQPSVKIMGREVKVLKRWGYDDEEEAEGESDSAVKQQDHETNAADAESKASTQTLVGEEPVDKKANEPSTTTNPAVQTEHPNLTSIATTSDIPLWGLDLSALRTSNSRLSTTSPTSSTLPIHTPHSALSYLLNSFATAPPTTSTENPPKKPPSSARSHNLALLLQALDLLFSSWAPTLGKQELDRRAWAWYVAVRPDVEGGQRGWGAKGTVKLREILKLSKGGVEAIEGVGDE